MIIRPAWIHNEILSQLSTLPPQGKLHKTCLAPNIHIPLYSFSSLYCHPLQCIYRLIFYFYLHVCIRVLCLCVCHVSKKVGRRKRILRVGITGGHKPLDRIPGVEHRRATSPRSPSPGLICLGMNGSDVQLTTDNSILIISTCKRISTFRSTNTGGINY